MTASEQYFNTAGEIEARDVSNRIDMTEEQRKNTRPDIDRTDVVFAEDGTESFSYIGKNVDGYEVYEVSEKTKSLSYKERQKVFLEIMEQEYRGRTAKFERNGHTYYALFDYRDVNKNIYGDNRSDLKGWKAKINIGADGDIFQLVENSRYDGSKQESGKNIKSHKGVNYWDYYVKTVQIDNTIFDLIANIRKKSDGAFVYSLQLNENKNIEASPSLGLPKGSLNRMLNASNNSISNGTDFVNENYETPVTYDDSGNVIPLSERFDDSKTDIRFQKKVDSNAKLNDNNSINNGGAVNGSKNTELLEQGTVSALGRGYDLVWKQSESARKILGYLGFVREGQTQNATDTGASDSRWLAPNAFKQQIDKGFKDGVLRALRGVSLSGKDVIGRELNNETLDLLKNTILKDEEGNILSLYHWTQNTFDKFKFGDIGFHFGTVQAAHDRYRMLKEENAANGIETPIGIYKEAYLNITNPIFMPDLEQWTAYDVAFHLVESGLISELQYDRLALTTGFYELSYDNPAIKTVRKILSDLGYDGILYYNDTEDTTSISAIALYPEQVVMVTDNGKPVKNSIASETQNGLPRGVLNFQLKSYAVETDRELLAQHLEENSEAVGEILKRSANISMNYRTMRRLIEKRLREYGITSEDRKKASEYISVVFLAAEHPSVQGKDVTEDMTKAIREALESTPYDFNPNAEDYREVVDILKGFEGRVYLTADQEAHVREQGYDIRWLRQRLF